jgi:type IV pilus assembly protein PilF
VANNLGILYAETGDAEKAEAEFTRAIEIAPRDAEGYLNLAMLHERTGEAAEARKVLQRVLAILPGHPAAVRMLESLK